MTGLVRPCSRRSVLSPRAYGGCCAISHAASEPMSARPFLLPPGSLLLAAVLAASGLPHAGTGAAPQFASSVNLVEVYATVSGRTRAPVTGLAAGDFEVFEDGRPQAIQVFSAGDFPLSVALAIDHSASMAGSTPAHRHRRRHSASWTGCAPRTR
ncbi:MAG: hypothetical protein MZV64_42720 [Ignavibacteriales bacterium]|nr:hypothetical protein [Ignavibacteriales bacterium]